MIQVAVIAARVVYWISSFVILAAFVALVLHLVPAVFSEGNGKHGSVDPSWELVAILGGVGIGLWVIAQVSASLIAWRLEQRENYL